MHNHGGLTGLDYGEIDELLIRVSGLGIELGSDAVKELGFGREPGKTDQPGETQQRLSRVP